MSVISLADEREKRSPHWSGCCICLGCKHEWVSVAPIGVMFVDCPSCGLPKGHPKHSGHQRAIAYSNATADRRP